jgi:predicted  nucleic acid-binding Zn-ribbon protein
MDRTVRALTDLSAVDDQLSGKEALMDGLAVALEERRAALRAAIPGVFLAAHDALGRVGRRPVVVQVRGGHCGGCYLRLPPQLDSTVRRRQSLCSCPHCGRLLYSSTRVSDREGAPESKHETADRLAGNVRKSKPARGISGKRRTRQKARASKR